MDSNGKKEPRKVIDISERLARKNPIDRLKHLKVRLDLEQAKVAIPMSLLSIVAIVTLANSNLLQTQPLVESREMASSGEIDPSRAIASIPTGTSASEDQIVKELSGKALSDVAVIGRSPSALEKFTFEALEGNYAVRMNADQKLVSLKFSAAQARSPLAFDKGFLQTHRQWMPVEFESSLRVQSVAAGRGTQQVFHLVNRFAMPVAEVTVQLDDQDRLLDLAIKPTNLK